jgi:hypothetical protein
MLSMQLVVVTKSKSTIFQKFICSAHQRNKQMLNVNSQSLVHR